LSPKANNNKSKKKADKEKQSHKAIELLFLLLFVFALFLLISLVGFSIDQNSNWLGQAGVITASLVSTATFGKYGAIVIPLIIILALIYWITERRFRLARWVIALITTGFFIGFGTAFISAWIDPDKADFLLTGLGPFWLAEQAVIYLHRFGVILLSFTIIIALAIILFDLKLTKILKASYNFFHNLIFAEKPQQLEIDRHDYEELPEEFALENDIEDEIQKEFADAEDTGVQSEGAISKVVGPREFPPLKLLNMPPPDQPEIDQAELEHNATLLEEKLASMRISAEVVKVNPGPVITRYDLRPSAEVKVSRIASLSDDIAMALKARGVRILAPIPGEAAVGVELANSQPQGVYIREVIGSNEFRGKSAPLTIAIGKDTNGNIFCADLAKMPHLLIAGATGSGKSVCMNTIITSLLYRCDPNDVRLLLIDPKKIELSLYSRLSEQHLLSPPGLGEEVITEPENAVKALQSVHAEMNRRYKILADAGVRSLEEYNHWIKSTSGEEGDEEDQREHLPYIVVIIDELADLMMTVRREFEELVARLAQMARAVGIHLIVATQRPSVDVVTGLIKANFPTRIAFRVATRVDSRTIIDSMGAEALLGKGDMLFFGMGAKLTRLHGALVTTEEVEQVIEFVKSQPPRESTFKLPDPEIQKLITNASGDSSNIEGVDELFEEAAKIVVRTEQGSVSVLQRRLRVGYARAARLIDQLEQAGIVGPFDGSKARQVMVTNEDLRERYGIEA
jgi:S-DNA-T family DNA segregation ATPase FtsK/SpoIIIE